MTTHRPPRRRGLMLLEMLITIGVFAIFLVLAGKLFAATLRLTHSSNIAARDMAAFESCVAALRRDAWDAVETTSLGGSGVRIRRGDGRTITWSEDDQGALVRSDEAGAEVARRWLGMGAKITVHANAAGLLVRASGDELRLVSQVLLARREEAP